MEYSTAIHRLHNTHVGTETSTNLSGSIEEDMSQDKCRPRNIPSGFRLEEFEFSFIIDDVDADHESELAEEVERSNARLNEIYATEGVNSDSNDSMDSKEKSDARIQQIKGEAESRKNAFAKLLEEHAQVIKQLKKMEDEPAVSGGEAGPTDV